MVTVLLSLEEDDRHEWRYDVDEASHHLVHRGWRHRKRNEHQRARSEVKGCRDSQVKRVAIHLQLLLIRLLCSWCHQHSSLLWVCGSIALHLPFFTSVDDEDGKLAGKHHRALEVRMREVVFIRYLVVLIELDDGVRRAEDEHHDHQEVDVAVVCFRSVCFSYHRSPKIFTNLNLSYNL